MDVGTSEKYLVLIVLPSNLVLVFCNKKYLSNFLVIGMNLVHEVGAEGRGEFCSSHVCKAVKGGIPA